MGSRSTEGEAGPPPVLLDISRLLVSSARPAPSGIDRVELAYARRWVGLAEDRCTFVAQGPAGTWSAVSRAAVADLVAALERSWSGQGADARQEAYQARRLATVLRLRAALGMGGRGLARALDRPGPKVFLLVSHRALEHQAPIRAMQSRGCAFVPLIHDLIPATHPEYARPGQSGRHLRRIGTTAALADAVIVNSAHTAQALAPHLRARTLPPPVLVAPLGIEPPPSPGAAPPATPYFLALGTIEPRKNHLLLLHLWRDLVGQHGAATPALLLIGRRGWENENVVDILERSPTLRGVVQELGALPDRRVWELLRGARALLFPSFAEGYGLPLAEALSVGVPAICSDLPALREVGGAVPDYLDPLDGAGWRARILDYAHPDSPARAAQLGRMGEWRAPRWDDHFRQVDGLLRRVSLRAALAAGTLARSLAPAATTLAAGVAGSRALPPAPARLA